MQDHYIRVQHSVLFRYYVLKMSPKWLCHDTGDLSDCIFRNIKATEMEITLRADTKRRSYLYEGIVIFIHIPISIMSITSGFVILLPLPRLPSNYCLSYPRSVPYVWDN